MLYIFVLLLIVCLALNLTYALMDPDLWWHIVIGRHILHHGFPHHDLWNAYSNGCIFRAYSWLPEIIFASIEKYCGLVGLLSLKILMVIIFISSLLYVTKKITKDLFFASIISGITVASSCQHLSLRPQMIAWICQIWVLYLAHLIYEKGWNKKIYIGTILAFSLWANSHLSTIIGIFLFVFWGFKGEKKNLIKLIFIPILGTLLTPYHGSEWLTFFTKFYHPFSNRNIAEFAPLQVNNYGGGLFLILLFLLCFFLDFYGKALSKCRLIALVAMTLGTLLVIKFLPNTTIVYAFAISYIFSIDNLKNMPNIYEGIKKLKACLSYFFGTGGAILLLCLCIVGFHNRYQKIVSLDNIAVNAMNFILDKKLSFPLLNSFNDGGYVMYRLADGKGNVSHKVVVDGRTNVNSKDISKLSTSAFHGKKDWYKYVEYVNPKTIIWQNDSPFVNLLLEKKDTWCRAYGEYLDDEEGKGFSVFVLKDEFPNLCLK